MYKIIKHKRIDGLEKLWKNLYNKNPNLSCYQEFEFNRIIKKYSRFSLGRYDFKSVFYELIGSGNETRMILPLYIRRKNGIKEIHFFGEYTWTGYLDFIYAADLSYSEFKWAMEAVAKDVGKARYYLNKINETSILNGFIERYCGENDVCVQVNQCFQIPIKSNYHDYFQNLSKNTRQNIRTSHNRLEKDGLSYSVKIFANEKVDKRTLRGIISIYNKREASRRDGLVRNFVVGISKRFLNPITIGLGKLENSYCSVLYIDGKIAGFCAGFVQKGKKIVLPYLAINESFSRYSPGGLLITESIKYLTDNCEIEYFDLSRGEEPYKARYGGVLHRNFHYEFASHSAGRGKE